MDDQRLSTKTSTKVSVGTKLVIATLALYGAIGLAFASIPFGTKHFETKTAYLPTKTTTCQDTDGGIVFEDAGAVKISGTSPRDIRVYSDSCTKAGQLTEYSCAADRTLETTVTTCGKGMMCDDGACVTSTPMVDASLLFHVEVRNMFALRAGNITYGEITLTNPNSFPIAVTDLSSSIQATYGLGTSTSSALFPEITTTTRPIALTFWNDEYEMTITYPAETLNHNGSGSTHVNYNWPEASAVRTGDERIVVPPGASTRLNFSLNLDGEYIKENMYVYLNPNIGSWINIETEEAYGPEQVQPFAQAIVHLRLAE